VEDDGIGPIGQMRLERNGEAIRIIGQRMAIVPINAHTMLIIDFKPTEGGFNMLCEPDLDIGWRMARRQVRIGKGITMVILCMSKGRCREQECKEHS
jgi:hypothetical protein